MASILIIILLINVSFSVLINNVYACAIEVTRGSGVNIDTTVVEHYTDVNVTDEIILEKDKEFTIDFTKTDNLSKWLSVFAYLEKTVYYKVVNNNKL